MRSCCFRRRFSASRALAPPGLSSLAIVTRKDAESRNIFFMAGEIREMDS